MLPIDTSVLRYDRTNVDSYEAADLNRVGVFCQTVADAAMVELSIIEQMRHEYDVAENPFLFPDFKVPALHLKIDFSLTDTYTIAQMHQYLDNVNRIISAFPPVNPKLMPGSMRFLTAESANNIEENLKFASENLVNRANQTEKYIVGTAAMFKYSGETYSGETI